MPRAASEAGSPRRRPSGPSAGETRSRRILARFTGARSAPSSAGSALGRGIVLSACRPSAAHRWARRGIGPVVVGQLEGWTVVVPTGPAAARHPYDDAVRSLAGRPVGLSMRPALGVFHVGRQVVLTVHPARWRAPQRWLIWTPRDGSVPPDGLPPASVDDVVAVAGGRSGTHARGDESVRRALRDVLDDGSLQPRTVLAEIFGILSLPGLALVSGPGTDALADLPGAREIHPSPRAARAFDRVVGEEARHLDEMEM